MGVQTVVEMVPENQSLVNGKQSMAGVSGMAAAVQEVMEGRQLPVKMIFD